MIKIDIKTDNAAFEDEGGPIEVARIVKGIAEVFDTYCYLPSPQHFSLRDINGNTVGKVSITED